MKSGYGTVQRAQQADATLREKTAQLQHGQSGLLAAQKKIDVLTTERAKAVAQLDHARAVAQQAALNLSYTVITAPVDGTVGARSLRVGQYVQAGTQLMAVVPLDAVYVVANFKETQLTHVRKGQPVDIRIDGFRGTRLSGHVDSLAPASGLEFALLPPDNATGNFTKIVQRIPVKIVLDEHGLAGLLRPGMSVEPTIDTKATVLAGREAQHQLASDTASSARTQLSQRGFQHVIVQPRWIILPILHGLSKYAGNASCLASREETAMTALQPTIESALPPYSRAAARRRTRRPPRSPLKSGSPCRRHPRRLHGGAQHPDHQCLARRHPGRDRRRHRRRRLDLDRLSDRRDRRHPADRLARAGVLGAPIYLLDQRGAVPAFSVACAFAQDLPQMIVLRASRASPAAC